MITNMENRNAGKKKLNRECEWCGNEYFGRSLFCSNECVEKFSERYHAEYRALTLKEKTLQKREEVFMKELELEGKNICYGK
jgi:YHS domain-containing protein